MFLLSVVFFINIKEDSRIDSREVYFENNNSFCGLNRFLSMKVTFIFSCFLYGKVGHEITLMNRLYLDISACFQNTGKHLVEATVAEPLTNHDTSV